MNKRITKSELKKLRAELPEGAYAQIAEYTGYAPASVEQILFKPERINKKNMKVLDHAISLAEQSSSKFDEFKDRIKYTI